MRRSCAPVSPAGWLRVLMAMVLAMVLAGCDQIGTKLDPYLSGVRGDPSSFRIDAGGSERWVVTGFCVRAFRTGTQPELQRWINLPADVQAVRIEGVGDTDCETGTKPDSAFQWTFELRAAPTAAAGSHEVTLELSVLGGAVTRVDLELVVGAPPITVRVAAAANGGGRVVGPGIDCGSDCDERVPLVPVRLLTFNAVPGAGQRLLQWSGDCSGTVASVTLVADRDLLCIANFGPAVADTAVLAVRLEGPGFVEALLPGGIRCGETCRWLYPLGTSIRLRAAPGAGHRFAGWSGGEVCTGEATSLTLVLEADTECIARFEPETPPVSVQTLDLTMVGQGSVQASIGGAPALTCLASCRMPLTTGATVSLVAQASAFGRFERWQGDCAVAGADTEPATTLLMDRPRQCTVRFLASSDLLWQPLGSDASGDAVSLNAEPVPSDAAQPVMLLDAAGRPWVAWVEAERLHVRRWQGSQWEVLDQGLDSGTVDASSQIALALDDAGQPMIAWAEQRPGTSGAQAPMHVQARRWDGTRWQRLGSGPVDDGTTQSAYEPSLATFQGQPAIATVERSATNPGLAGVRVRRWNGTAWEPAAVGIGPTLVGSADDPAHTRLVALGGSLAVVFFDHTTQRFRLSVLTGGAWIDAPGFEALNAGAPAVVVDPVEGLLLAWPPSAPAPQFTVQRWRDGTWSPLGGAHGSTGTGARVDAVSLHRNPYTGKLLLGFAEARTGQSLFRVREWTGLAWADLGGPIGPTGRLGSGTAFGLAVGSAARPMIVTRVSNLGFINGSLVSDVALQVRELR